MATRSRLSLLLAWAGRAAADRECPYWGSPVAVAEIEEHLNEVSGLVASQRNPGLLWAIMDSGSGPYVYAISSETGRQLGVITLVDAMGEDLPATDWEDMALGPCPGAVETTCVWVADVGDNNEIRDGVSQPTPYLLAFEEPLVESNGGFTLTIDYATMYPFTYPEGPHNCEAMVVDPTGTPFLITKPTDYGVEVGEVYRVDLLSDGNTAVLLGGLPLGWVVTAADTFPDGSRLIVRNYYSTYQVYLGAGGVAEAANASLSSYKPLLAGLDAQGETIAYDANAGALWHLSEESPLEVRPVLWKVPCVPIAPLAFAPIATILRYTKSVWCYLFYPLTGQEAPEECWLAGGR